MAKNVLIHGVRYNGINSVRFAQTTGSEMATFRDTSSATATASDILETKTAYGPDGIIEGNIRNIGTIEEEIDSLRSPTIIPSGFTDGGIVGIKQSEQDKIVPANIRAGVTILGVEGATNVIDTSTLDGAISGDIAEGMVAFSNGQRYVGTGSFFDISETTATPEDVAEGKIFFTADGQRAVGTAVFGPRNAVLGTATIGNCVIAPEPEQYM